MPEDSSATPEPDATQPVQPVPAPGHDDSSAGAGVSKAGAWTAVAAPGKPDGEVDTRS